MAIPRIFVSTVIKEHSTISITDTSSIHKIRDVLRLKKDARLIVFDGQGGQSQASIARIEKHQIVCYVGSAVNDTRESRFRVTLGLPVIKESALEIALQKATELGVDHVLIYPADHSYKKSFSQERVKRFSRIIQEASRQSERTAVPGISFTASLDELISATAAIPCRIYLECRDPAVSQDVIQYIRQASEVMVIVGPEGDLSGHEKELLKKHQVIPWSLPLPVLRAETAASFAVGLAKYIHNIV